ncbi:histidine kinase [Flavitalea sp. BT771]|uniref:sensor histidine kinase n=1 Tax=Flavitalea sp. BT771 TaxID=3063329 RepID=UPI0026E1251E|nr:histidine kinase [Flavitalea sp. BT771]MDO6434835.1 histidine kinase [Flavitalea sp. BT771]MDV6223735.1 histidine kinase [Flavitalea sp. BT771]
MTSGDANPAGDDYFYSMEAYPFIFSNELSYRLKRHLLFWSLWWLTQAFLYSFAHGWSQLTYPQALALSMVDALFYMAPHIFLSYSLIYYVIPKFVVKGKYVQTAILVVLLFIATGAMSAAISVYVLDGARRWILGDFVPRRLDNISSFFMSLMAGLRGGVTIGGVAAAIKLMKYWYVKQARNLELQKENVASQLQLLKAQVHPHFLFNTLNNVYSHAQVGSSSAPVLIAGLSDLLRYMLYECDRPLVLLDKELKMVEDYVLLERVRYGNKLDVVVQLSGNTRDVYIAPLLLLPFIENCFKHGTSQMLDQPWVSLQIVLDGDEMKMKLLNGKAPGLSIGGGGIGIANVQKRLEFMYPDKHQLVINNEDDVYIVNLRLQLERRAGSEVRHVVNANNKHYEPAQ